MNTTALARAGFGFSHVELGTPLHQWGGTDEVWPADFNRDGRLDFAVIADNQMRVAVLLTNGATVTLPTQGIDRFAVADVNGDGTEDVVAVVGVLHVLTYLGDGRGGFIASPMTALPEAGVALSIGDADADGTPDLAILGGLGNGPVWVMHGNGDGTFTLAVTAGVGGSGPSLTMGDINRDGRLDVAALLWDGRVAILWGDRAGGLAPGPVIPFFTDPLDFIGNPSRIALADLNRDGYLDILASGPTSILAEHTHIGIALGGPEGPAVPTFLDGTQVSWAFAIGDVTMDGRPDIVTGAGEVFAGHGDGTFAAPEAFDYFGTDVRVLDVTHDGLPDIVFAASRGAAGVLVNRRGDRNRRAGRVRRPGPHCRVRGSVERWRGHRRCQRGRSRLARAVGRMARWQRRGAGDDLELHASTVRRRPLHLHLRRARRPGRRVDGHNDPDDHPDEGDRPPRWRRVEHWLVAVRQ